MKTKKNEECKECQITTTISGFTFFIKNYISLINIVVKGKKVKSSSYHHISFTVFMRCRYLKRSNDTPKLNIHKYNNYNIIKIHINRLTLTMQILIAMDYLILMSRSTFILQNDKSMWQGIFSHPVEVTGFVYLRNYFLSYVHLKDLYKNLKEIESSKLHRSLG